MAAHISTTISGVNASGLPSFSLVHGAVRVPTPLLTAETVAMLDAVGHQEVAAGRRWPCRHLRTRHAQRHPSVRTRIRS